MSERNLTRRAFLAATTTTAAATVLSSCATNGARVVPGRISPNEKMNVAAIGAGGKGLGDIMACRDENIVAFADPDWDRCAEAFHRLPDATPYKDFRKMLEEMPEIDAVTISTPDHTHISAADAAMRLGKHVYVQKPLTHTIAEARYLTKLARETGVVTQMGNQGHSNDGAREMCEMIWSGAIGDVKECHIWTNRPVWPQGIPDPLPQQPVPETMDWDLWIGPAPMRPYNKGYAPFAWRGWWDFGCGAVGDMACHIMDTPFWSLKLMDAKSYTIEAVQQDGMNAQTAPNSSIIKFQFPARADMGPVDVYWYDGGLLPKRPDDIPEDQRLGDGNNGSLFIGTNGYATTGEYGNRSRLMPDERMADYEMPEPWIPRVPRENHYQNWIDACKGETEAVSHFDYAGPLTEVANFGNVALFLGVGETLEFDVESMRITNNAAANAYLTKEYRKGWEVPV